MGVCYSSDIVHVRMRELTNAQGRSVSLVLGLLLHVMLLHTCLQCGGADSSADRLFKVVWNFRTPACARKIKGMRTWGIAINHGYTSQGDQIVHLHADQGQMGIWPHLDGTTPHHGGLPQEGNLSAHEIELRADIDKYVQDDSHGYAVLDMRMWHPLFSRTHENRSEPYRELSLRRARRGESYQDWAQEQAQARAKHQWDYSARQFFEKTLRIANSMRPNRRWGFFRFPRDIDARDSRPNEELGWLYEVSTGLYPALEFDTFKEGKLGFEEWLKRQEKTIEETLWVHLRDSLPCTPVVPYVPLQHSNGLFLNQSYLDATIGQAASMGADGVVLWSSQAETPGTDHCPLNQEYLQDTLGPYVSDLLNRLSGCSLAYCGGHGRCIRSRFSRYHPDQFTPCPLSGQLLKKKQDIAEEYDPLNNDRHSGHFLKTSDFENFQRLTGPLVDSDADSRGSDENSRGSDEDNSGSGGKKKGSDVNINRSYEYSRGPVGESRGSNKKTHGIDGNSRGSDEDSRGSDEDSRGSDEDSRGSDEDSRGLYEDSHGTGGESHGSNKSRHGLDGNSSYPGGNSSDSNGNSSVSEENNLGLDENSSGGNGRDSDANSLGSDRNRRGSAGRGRFPRHPLHQDIACHCFCGWVGPRCETKWGTVCHRGVDEKPLQVSKLRSAGWATEAPAALVLSSLAALARSAGDAWL